MPGFLSLILPFLFACLIAGVVVALIKRAPASVIDGEYKQFACYAVLVIFVLWALYWISGVWPELTHAGRG